MIATYMGLITQIDDHIGRLTKWLDETGRAEDTMIIFTSDHGDYLGDHWMGEKQYFHDPSVKVPLIVVDPSPEANETRGTVDDHLSEAIDLVPTIIEYMGGELRGNILEGRSLLPLLRGQKTPWRECVFAEADYSRSATREALGRTPQECKMVMAFDGRWKYIHTQDLPPMLFDLKEDPTELIDLGQRDGYEQIRAKMDAKVRDWAFGSKMRITQSDAFITAQGPAFTRGILIGFWDEPELE